MKPHVKYLVIDTGLAVGGIAFSPIWQHKTIAATIPGTVLSAGFIRITDGGQIECRGESDSLGLRALPGDEFYFQHPVE